MRGCIGDLALTRDVTKLWYISECQSYLTNRFCEVELHKTDFLRIMSNLHVRSWKCYAGSLLVNTFVN